jgi:hypothetical protein
MPPEGRLGIRDSLREAIVDAGNGRLDVVGPLPEPSPRRARAASPKTHPNSRKPSRRRVSFSVVTSSSQRVYVLCPYLML